MATAKKLKSGNYRVRVYDKRINATKSFTAPTKKEAEKLASEYLLNKLLEDRLTIAKATEDYITIKSKVLSPTTTSAYRSILHNNMCDLLEYDIETITPQIIQGWINSLSLTLSPKSVHNAYGLLTAVLNYNDIDIKLSKIVLPRKVKQFKELPPPQLVINAFRGTEIELPVLLAVWCGMRMSEILGVRPCDIFNHTLTISQVAVKVDGVMVYKQNAKTYNSNRQITLPPPILALIPKDIPKSKPVVKLTQAQIYRRFVTVMRDLGYNITFHDLRHVNASVMSALGVPDLYAMERGGWSNTNTLRGVYQQTFTDKRKAVDGIIDDYFMQLYG